MKEFNIILLEDSPFDVELIKRELEKAGIPFTARVVTDRPEFEGALRDFNPDVVLCDHSMPQFNSIEAFDVFKQFQKEANVLIPFILVTGEVSEDFAVQCLKAGVDDYILKDRLKRLPLSIESAIEKCRAKSERQKYLREVILREALMREAGHLAQLGSWQADLVTGEHTWSEETYSICGYGMGEVTPGFEAFFDVVHPDDVALLRRHYDGALRDHIDELEGEFRIVDKKENLKYIHAKLQVHRDASGIPVRLVGFNLDITERKRTEMRLEEGKQEYKSLFDQNPDAVFLLDRSGTFTNANAAVLELAGHTLDALRTMNFRQFVPPEDLERINHHFLCALNRQPQRYRFSMVNREGKTVALDVTCMPMVINGEVMGVYGLAKDITRKEQLEQLLEKAYRFARIGGWELDVRTASVTWTDITREIHEVAADFKPTFETAILFFKEGRSRETIGELVRRCLETGQPYDVELQIITGNGNERWIRATGEAEMDNGRCVRMFGTLQDIHGRKIAEEAAREACREKVDILESIGDAFFAVDNCWTVTYWNSMAERILRMPRQNILGKNLWEVYADAIPLAFYREYHKAMKGNIPVHFEEYYPGLNVWIAVNVYPSTTGLSIYFKDITDQKKYVGEIEKQNQQLREIARIQSHDVRAPLARIMGLTKLLQNGLEHDRELPGLLNQVMTNASELDDMIRRIVRITENLGEPGR